MPIIVSNCQHCDEQQFQTLSCVHYTIFSVIKLNLFIGPLLLDRILALEKNYPYISHTSCSKILARFESIFFLPSIVYSLILNIILYINICRGGGGGGGWCACSMLIGHCNTLQLISNDG